MVKLNWKRPQFRRQGKELVNAREERERLKQETAKYEERLMAKEFSNANTGILFNNQDRKQKDTDRDYGGSINVVCPHCDAGSDHWLNGWLKTSNKTGAKFLSLSVKSKVQKAEVVAQPTAGNGAHGRDDDMSDEIPF